MALRIRLTVETTIPIEVEGITPDQLHDKPLSEIERLDVFHGNQKLPLAELFSVEGDATDMIVEWEGDLSGVHWIGTKMSAGTIRMLGNGGRHIGSEMKGGEIHVEGNVGDWVGGEMRGGLIHVRGRAGHLVGAGYRGSRQGMKGGTILIDGDAGNEIGHTLRRGMIAIGGNVGDLAGFNMLAGSILLFGEFGIRHGAGMKRGTIAFLGNDTPSLLPTFRRACRYSPDVMQLVLRSLRHNDFQVPDDLFEAQFNLYNGDMIEGGRGEILVKPVANGRADK
jgi:formylmethanofuran dehydrogenase subunit C